MKFMHNNFIKKYFYTSLACFFCSFYPLVAQDNIHTTTQTTSPATPQENTQIFLQNTEENTLETPPLPTSPQDSLHLKNLKFIYGIDFDFLLDNTEESQKYWPTRTLFTGSIAPEIGISFKNQNLRVGGHFIQNLGEKYPAKNLLTFSYDFTYKDIKAFFGIFHKKQWIGEYSQLFYRKDFLFYNPLINGVLFQYDSQKYDLQAEFIFDWYGGDITKRIDEFLTQGFLKKSFFNKKLFFGGSFLLYHFKNDEFLNLDGGNFDTYLLDRFYYELFIGSNLQSLTPSMDKLLFKFSNLSSLERKRRLSTGLDPFSNLLGWQFDFQAQYKGFGFENSLYFGKNQYKYFSTYGEDFYAGLPFYQSPLFDRAEIYYEYKNDYLTGRFSFILHFTQDALAYQQMLSLSLDTHKLFRLLLRK
ncbi:hypothetical protein LW133_00080 [Helicobacter sp. faydin-H8]|nr:hypothetical protein [Helicobacter anatolicus]